MPRPCANIWEAVLLNTITARFRVMGALACFISGCALEQGADDEDSADVVSQALATNVAVYTNTAPVSSWQNWSWSTTVALANTDSPLASGSSNHIKATASNAGAALALAHPGGNLNVADYDSISFDVRGSSSSLGLKIQTLAGGGSGVQVTVPVTTSWTRQSIKVSALAGSLGTFGKIDWVASQTGQTYYVDNITLVAKATSQSQTTSTPSSPITVKKNDVVTLNSSAGPYSVYVPNSYDATHHTPTKVLLWLHGCGGNAYGDAWATSPGGNQDWLSVSVGGRDGGCWDTNTDASLALAALDSVKTHLNVDTRRVIIGGYSSGGDMAYRTAFYNTKRFAGVLVENTSPFRDTGSSQSASLAAATWKINIVHLAHTGDTTYPIAGVRAETDAVKAAGFPLTRLERAGAHWDAEGTSSGTNYDMRNQLLPYIGAGWVAPL